MVEEAHRLTCNRPAALAITLTALLAQTWQRLRIVVSDQGDVPVLDASPELATVLRLLRAFRFDPEERLTKEGT